MRADHIKTQERGSPSRDWFAPIVADCEADLGSLLCDQCLLVFDVAVVARTNWRIAFGAARSGAGRNAFDDRVVVRLVKKGDRDPADLVCDIRRRVNDTVHVGQPAVVGPAHHQIADVDDEELGPRFDFNPVLVACPHLKASWLVLTH